MAPESGVMERPTILEESELLMGKILAYQEQRRAIVKPIDDEAAKTIREDMGYEPIETVNTTSLIDTRVKAVRPAVKINYLKKVLPLTRKSAETTLNSRIAVEKIIKGEDDRLIVIIGPCSIHDPEAALEYADWVRSMREIYGEDLEIVMRAYVEKPRTELGWKGLMNDPKLKGKTNISLGMTVSRMLLLQITNKEVPVAVERIDNRTTQTLDGLVTYDAIGARDVLSTRARNYLSVTSAVGGAKNTPDGNIDSAVQAVYTANAEHTYVGDHDEDDIAEIESTGNDTIHIILRGGDKGPNYSARYVKEAEDKLRAKGLNVAVGIDTNHGNSGKDYTKQIEVVKDVGIQIALGNRAIKLVMIESNLKADKQDLEKTLAEGKELVYGQSITDGCSDLKESEDMLQMLAVSVRTRRKLLTSSSV